MKILLADDEKSVQHVLGRRLQARGYEVVTASNGEEAVQKAGNEHPDLILMDIMMPKKNGNEAAAELHERKDTAHIPIIFLTCLVNNEEARRMNYKSGNHRIMGKPIDPNGLIRLIEETRHN